MAEEILKKIPYDESGNRLSFITDAETVYVGEQTLLEYLSSLKGTLKGTNGTNGSFIEDIVVKYTCVSPENNTLENVAALPEKVWKLSSPKVTEEAPNLWKRTVTTVKKDSETKTYTEYLFCGSLGTPGVDGNWREWIFKIADVTTSKELLLEQLDACYSDPLFLNNDFVPPNLGWYDDMQEVVADNTVQWCASRDKENGQWQKFKNLKIFNRKAANGGITNNIYTKITADLKKIDTSLWEADRLNLIENITYSKGSVVNIPENTKYTWSDSAPDSEENDIVFQATCYFVEGVCINIDSPIRITGAMGLGSDGAGVEFAYRVADTDDVEAIGQVPGSYKHFKGGGGWYDTAGESQISSLHPYLFMSQRFGHYNSDEDWCWRYEKVYYGVSPNDPSVLPVSAAPDGWNYGWSAPVIWSAWGQDGVDGDGVLYVYLRLTELEYLFVSADPNRWNFAGGVTSIDPADTSDQNNPNNPINCTLKYTLDKDIYEYLGIVDWKGGYLVLNSVSGKYNKINKNGELLVLDKPFIIPQILIILPEEEFNQSMSEYMDCSYNFEWGGDSLPEYNGLDTVTGTVKYKRNYRSGEIYSYKIVYLEEGDTSNVLFSKSGVLLSTNTKSHTAPSTYTKDGVTYSRVTVDSTLTITSTNKEIVFFYAKNS